MAKLTALSLAEAQRLGREFGLEITELEPLEAGSVNSNFRIVTSDGRALFGRLNEEQNASGAERELELLEALSYAGVKVGKPLRRRTGGFLTEHAGKPFAIFPWVPGASLCKKLVTAEHCRKIGAALAQVHQAEVEAGRLGPGRFQPTDMLDRLEFVERESGRPDLLQDVAKVRALTRTTRRAATRRCRTVWCTVTCFETTCSGPVTRSRRCSISRASFTGRFRTTWR